MRNRLIALVLLGLALCASCLLLLGAAEQGHPYAGFGFRRCSSEAVHYLHKGYNTDAPYTMHYLFTRTGEKSCRRTLEIHWHTKVCSDCGYQYPGDYPLACRIRHERGGREYLTPCTEHSSYFVCTQ